MPFFAVAWLQAALLALGLAACSGSTSEQADAGGDNQPPTVNAGADVVLRLPDDTVELRVVAVDPENDSLQYEWRKATGGVATLSGAASDTVLVTGLAEGVYTFTVTVTDDQGASAEDSVQVTVNPANLPPTVIGGDDLNLTVPTSTATLTAVASDADGTVVAHAWTQVSGPAATLSGEATAALALSGLTVGSRAFQITVTDNEGATGSDVVVINVTATANEPPTVSAGADQTIQLPSSGVTFHATAADGDGTIESYEWTKVSGGAATLSGATTEDLTVTGLAAGAYVFKVRVTDDQGGTASDNVALTVQAANAAPNVNAGPDKALTLPTNAVTLTGSANDSDGTIASYAWTKRSGPAATLAGQTTAVLSLTGLVAGTYVFRLTAVDDQGASAFDEAQVVVTGDEPAGCVGTTYYISTSGSDATGNGTMAMPWKTLAKATQEVTTAGSTIRVTAGTYTENAQSFLARGVCLEGEGAATTIIKGGITTDYAALIELVSPDGTDGAQSISHLTFDGQYVSPSNHKTWLAIWVTGRSNVSIHDCVIKNFLWRGVIFNGINTDNPGTDVGYQHATGNSFHHNTVTNSADYGLSGGGSGALNLGFQDGMLIHDNLIQQNERPEGLNGWPIKYWNQGWLKGCKIYNNTLIKKPYGGDYPGQNGWDFAIEFFNIQGLEIYGNDIQNGAIDLNYNYKAGYAYSVWIHDNVISNPVPNAKVEGGIILEFRTESALIERNTFINKSYGVTFNTRGVENYGGDNLPNPGGTPVGGYSYLLENTIRNNLFVNMYTGQGVGNSFGIGVISEGTDDPQINGLYLYNNTLVAHATNPSYIGIDLTSMPLGNGQNIRIRNNIVTGFDNDWFRGSNPPNINGMTLTHNDAHGNGTNTPSWPGGNPANYTVGNNLSVPPQFVSTTNFTLQPGSMCIDAGVDVGLPFEGGAPDLGYAEFGAP